MTEKEIVNRVITGHRLIEPISLKEYVVLKVMRPSGGFSRGKKSQLIALSKDEAIKLGEVLKGLTQ